mgnify:CR=1 FL=1
MIKKLVTLWLLISFHLTFGQIVINELDSDTPSIDDQEFVELKEIAEGMGFLGVLSGPLVRSSYRAGRLWAQSMIKRGDECEAIAQQFSAARKALDKAYQEMLICLAEEAILSPEQSNQEKLVQLRAIFTKYS